MGYSADSFSAGEQPTTAKWNKLWTNDASFNDGTGIANLEIGSGHTSLKIDYKFRVFQTGATATGNNAYAVVAFDTKSFDTGNNVASGVFTAPVAGFYHFNWATQVTLSTGASETFIASLFVGGFIRSGGHLITHPGTSSTPLQGSGGSDLVQLAANDTVDIRVFASAARSLNVSSTERNYFSGYLVSQT